MSSFTVSSYAECTKQFPGPGGHGGRGESERQGTRAGDSGGGSWLHELPPRHRPGDSED